MPLLDAEPEPQSNLALIVRTIIATVLSLAILTSAVANIYFYYKIDGLQKDIKSIKSDVSGSTANNDIESEIRQLATKLDDIGSDISKIESDVAGIQSDVAGIESDVSSIQLKIGY